MRGYRGGDRRHRSRRRDVLAPIAHRARWLADAPPEEIGLANTALDLGRSESEQAQHPGIAEVAHRQDRAQAREDEPARKERASAPPIEHLDPLRAGKAGEATPPPGPTRRKHQGGVLDQHEEQPHEYAGRRLLGRDEAIDVPGHFGLLARRRNRAATGKGRVGRSRDRRPFPGREAARCRYRPWVAGEESAQEPTRGQCKENDKSATHGPPTIAIRRFLPRAGAGVGFPWMKRRHGAQVVAGARCPIREQALGSEGATPSDESEAAFDLLLEDGDVLAAGPRRIEVLATPKHTPACTSYRIGEQVFVGDLLSFPGDRPPACGHVHGTRQDLRRSLARLLGLDHRVRFLPGHDQRTRHTDRTRSALGHADLLRLIDRFAATV